MTCPGYPHRVRVLLSDSVIARSVRARSRQSAAARP